MTFGDAIEAMKDGAYVARLGWNGKNQFIYMEYGISIEIGSFRGKAQKAFIYRARLNNEVLKKDTEITINPHIDMITADNRLVCGWLASQTDMIATDWYVIGMENRETIPGECHDKD